MIVKINGVQIQPTWGELIKEAQEIGLKVGEVRNFLQENKKPVGGVTNGRGVKIPRNN